MCMAGSCTCIKGLTSVCACMQPVQLHGSLGREAATGRGTVLATRELLKHSRAGTIAGKSFVIQVSHASARSVPYTHPRLCFSYSRNYMQAMHMHAQSSACRQIPKTSNLDLWHRPESEYLNVLCCCIGGFM